MTTVRIGLTETCNAYADMPSSVQELARLGPRMNDVRQANLDHHATLIERAARLGTEILCLGELCTGPYFALTCDPVWFALAEDAVSGPSVRFFQELAARHQVCLIVPLYEHDATSGRRYNTAVVLDRDGTHLGTYRKAHLPRGINDRGAFDETFYYDRAEELTFPVFDVGVCRFGLSICYDRHFEYMARMYKKRDAQVIFSPSVTFGTQSERMWPMEFAVDALRHRVFLAGSNRRGAEKPWDQTYFGASHVVGPEGRIEELQSPEGLVIVDLDLEQLDLPAGSGWELSRDRRSGPRGV